MRICYGCMRSYPEGGSCGCGWDPSREKDTPRLPLGSIVGWQYEVGRILDRDRDGIHYLGLDRKTGQRVRIREFFAWGLERVCDGQVRPIWTGMEEEIALKRDMFILEAATMAVLQDVPGMIHQKTWFQENGTIYSVREYMGGPSLDEWISDRGKCSLQETLAVLEPVAQALTAIHRRGMTHWHMTPLEILMTPRGAVLTGFGEKFIPDMRPPDHSGPLLPYEVCQPLELGYGRRTGDVRADVHMLAAAVYYCLTGMQFSAFQLLERGGLDRSLAKLKPWQWDALEKGLALHPRDRTESVELFIRSLKEKPAIEAKPAPEEEKSQTGGPKRPWWRREK